MKTFSKFAPLLCLLVLASLLHAQTDVKTINVTFTTIDVPGAGLTQVYGVNSAGDVVGFYSTGYNDPNDHGFLLSGGNFTFLDYPGTDSTVATSITDSGLVVGYYGSFTGGGFFYSGGTFAALNAGKNSRTFIWRMDNAGDIVGSAGTPYETRAFQDRGLRFRTISFPGTYVYAYATGINTNGQIVGWVNSDAYLFSNGQFRNIDFPGATETEAWDINSTGIVAGWYFLGGTDYGFALFKGKYLSFSYPGAATFAAGINSAGQIVGTYTFDFVTFHGFVTNPITTKEFE
jgi:uncharacterized membrane protein